MKSKPTLFLLITIIAGLRSSAQDEDLLKGVTDTLPKKEYVYNAFKAPRVIMSHSMEMLRPGVLSFVILHRFSPVNNGISDFFGLDHAKTRLSLDYGISNNLSVGIGRVFSPDDKDVDGFVKWRIIQQSKGPKSMPFSLVAVTGTTIIGTPWSDPTRENLFSSRVAYYGQAIIGRKFNEQLTLQLSPVLLHRNFVETAADPNDLFAAGFGGRVKLSKRVSLNVDYYYVVNPNEAIKPYNPLAIGFDIETGGHVFQLHFTNTAGMNEKEFLTASENTGKKGDIRFGFNISRAFQIAKKK
jgi:hypothetical protein